MEGQVNGAESEIVIKSGEHRIWSVSSSPLGKLPDGRRLVVTMATDITERKRAEDALRLSELKLERAQRMAALGHWEADFDSETSVWSDEVFRIFGVGKDTIAPSRRAFVSLVHPDDRQAVEEALQRSLSTGEPYSVIHRVVLSGGEIRHVEEYAEMVRDENGRIRGMVGTAQDITSHKLLEEQLHHAQRMEAIGRLAGGIAHDFNNLLTVVNGYSQLLLQNMSSEDDNRSSVEEIQKAGTRAARLTGQLLAFSRKQMMNPCVLDLNAVLDRMRGLLSRLIPENLELRLELSPLLGRVRVDEGHMEQVVMNLVVNAADAMPTGGLLTIETMNREVASGEVLSQGGTVPPGRYTVIMVRDQGVGMDDSTLVRIFEPFFTTKQVGKGTGLGLSTVFGIVTQSGGYVQVSSAEGKGSEFSIYLPAVTGEQEAETEAAPAAVEHMRTGAILLVEDEAVVRKFAARLLRGAGYRVLTAGDGREALRILEANEGDRPLDLLITDLVMPGLSGLELARRVRGECPGLPVLFMSGYSEYEGAPGEDLIDGNLLPKPFTAEALLAKVGEALKTG